MDDNESSRALRLVLSETNDVLTGLKEMHAADWQNAKGPVQLNITALAGTGGFVGFALRHAWPMPAAPSWLPALGFTGLLVSVVTFVVTYREAARAPGVGIGIPAGRYVRIVDRSHAPLEATMRALIRDKDDLVYRNAMLIWRRRRRADRGVALMVASVAVVLSAMALILGGRFLA